MIEVVAAGWATTVQDLGRPGLAHVGVPASGMVDPALGRLANRLVGNPEDAPLFETCGGLELRAEASLLVASTVELTPRHLTPGQTFREPGGHGRLWHYVAVRGGVGDARVLGSASTDTLSGLGPPPVAAGVRFAVGRDPGSSVPADHAPLRPLGGAARFTPGPRADWFAGDWPDRLAHGEWTVGASSRVGVRLTAAAPPVRVRAGELPSEGLVRGALQAPPSGELVMMLADHPTTGGYPVIAVVHPDDVAVIAQTRPGRTVRLRPA